MVTQAAAEFHLSRCVLDPIYAISDLTHDARRVTWTQLKEWAAGENMPRMLPDFNLWWLATSIKYRLLTTRLYVIDMKQIADLVRVPRSLAKWTV